MQIFALDELQLSSKIFMQVVSKKWLKFKSLESFAGKGVVATATKIYKGISARTSAVLSATIIVPIIIPIVITSITAHNYSPWLS